MKIFQSMPEMGLSADVITCSSVISALAKGKQHKLALEVTAVPFSDPGTVACHIRKRDAGRKSHELRTVAFPPPFGCQPIPVHSDSLQVCCPTPAASMISSPPPGPYPCTNPTVPHVYTSKQLIPRGLCCAMQVFEQMQENGIQPDVVTCCSLISALENGGQWLTALQLFIQMCSGERSDGTPCPLQATGARLKQVDAPSEPHKTPPPPPFLLTALLKSHSGFTVSKALLAPTVFPAEASPRFRAKDISDSNFHCSVCHQQCLATSVVRFTMCCGAGNQQGAAGA